MNRVTACPVCGSPVATVVSSLQVLDWFDVDCPQCGRFGFAGQEEPMLDRLCLEERVRLSAELGAAADAGDPVYLFYGLTRAVLERGWRSAR